MIAEMMALLFELKPTTLLSSSTSSKMKMQQATLFLITLHPMTQQFTENPFKTPNS
jgi:hypothetical protein